MHTILLQVLYISLLWCTLQFRFKKVYSKGSTRDCDDPQNECLVNVTCELKCALGELQH